MNDCILCRIVRREVSAEVLYEDEHVLAILDINPIHFGHALVFPKAHCADFLALPATCYASVLTAAQRVTSALVAGLRLEGYNLFTNNGRIAGQSVFHFHLHVTPRYPNDNIRFVLQLKKYADGEMSETARLIRAHLPH
ncbi:MAG: HIT domain-containing protein [Bacteroidota bacterium]